MTNLQSVDNVHPCHARVQELVRWLDKDWRERWRTMLVQVLAQPPIQVRALTQTLAQAPAQTLVPAQTLAIA